MLSRLSRLFIRGEFPKPGYYQVTTRINAQGISWKDNSVTLRLPHENGLQKGRFVLQLDPAAENSFQKSTIFQYRTVASPSTLFVLFERKSASSLSVFSIAPFPINRLFSLHLDCLWCGSSFLGIRVQTMPDGKHLRSQVWLNDSVTSFLSLTATLLHHRNGSGVCAPLSSPSMYIAISACCYRYLVDPNNGSFYGFLDQCVIDRGFHTSGSNFTGSSTQTLQCFAWLSQPETFDGSEILAQEALKHDLAQLKVP